MKAEGFFNADFKRYAHWWTRIDIPDDDYPSSKGNYSLLCEDQMMSPQYIKPETKTRCPKCVAKRKQDKMDEEMRNEDKFDDFKAIICL